MVDAKVWIKSLVVALTWKSCGRISFHVFVQETTQTVYNWQYINSVCLWSRVVGELCEDESIQSLIYPLTQTIIGTIKSVHDILSFRFDYLSLLNNCCFMVLVGHI